MFRGVSFDIPWQWPSSTSASSSSSVESEDISNGDEDAPCHTPDLAFINELIENIERNPPGQEAHLLLMQHYAVCGWHDAAQEEAHQVLKIDRNAKEAQQYLEDRRKIDQKARLRGGNTRVKTGLFDDDIRPERQSVQASVWWPSLSPITSIATSLQELEDGYIALLENAKLCLNETKLLKDLKGPNCEPQILDLEALAKGRVSSVVRIEHLESVKVVADAIVAESKNEGQNGLNVAVKDLEELARWCRRSGSSPENPNKGKGRSTGEDDQDSVRTALVKRVYALKALLPKSLQPIAGLALMHAEHEILHREYINDETMAFDPVSDIPRANFWTSEDGYAWDMDELAGAIRSGKGVMRNPLSKQMFTRADIRAIIQHPLGKGLQALQMEQSKLKRGVRPQTIEELDRLAKVLLVDMSEDGKASHVAIETFVSYRETLPGVEQNAVNNLQVPAKDSHTGMPFDMTIGDAVKDIEANVMCSHKGGDLLAQAVKYLK